MAPHWVEALVATATWYLAPVVALGISVAYFRASPRDMSLLWRVLASIHGVLIAFIYVTAFLVDFSGHSGQQWGRPFGWSLLLPVISMVIALAKLKRSKLMHLLMIPEVACLLWIGFIGGMAITGDRL